MGQTTAIFALLCLLGALEGWLRSISVEPERRRNAFRGTLGALGFAIVFGLLAVFNFVVAPGPDPAFQSPWEIARLLVMALVVVAFVAAEAMRVVRRMRGDQQSRQESSRFS
jgi:hypothetical protein